MSAQTVGTVAAPERRGARRERRHLRPVHDGPRRHPLVFFVLYAVLLATAVLGAVTLNALAAEDAVQLRELQSAVVQAERQFDELEVQVASLEDPARIREIAEMRGMVPGDPRYLVPEQGLPDDRVPPTTEDPLKPLRAAQR